MHHAHPYRSTWWRRAVARLEQLLAARHERHAGARRG